VSRRVHGEAEYLVASILQPHPRNHDQEKLHRGRGNIVQVRHGRAEPMEAVDGIKEIVAPSPGLPTRSDLPGTEAGPWVARAPVFSESGRAHCFRIFSPRGRLNAQPPNQAARGFPHPLDEFCSPTDWGHPKRPSNFQPIPCLPNVSARAR